MDKDIAISVKKVSKTFRIPHEKVSSVRGAFVGALSSFHLPFLRGGQGGVSYEEFKALDDVSFEVKKGEFFGIIGRNGSGKSTLLKVLAGIYQADKGKVKINGMISPFLELGIGFNPELSGRDNVYLNATVLGMTKKQIDEKFDSIVAFSELERFIDQKLKNYSSGMQVRLAFSVSIHANRDILLMDEVLAVGDSNFQSKCLEEFNRYKEIGRTVIIVTHDIAVVQRYCDRAMLLRNGKIMMIGKAGEVGGKYTFQNMIDEENRIDDERNKNFQRPRNETRPGAVKTAEITDVVFMGEDGRRKTVFQTGDDIVARIHFNASKKIEKPVFGVAVYTQDGIHISGPNTKTSGYEIGHIHGIGYVDFIISRNFFFTGNFRLTVALFGWECITPFDVRENAFTFKVMSREENQNGIVKLETSWKISEPSVGR